MVANKIKAVKDNKSPGVDGILPTILMETVEQISKPIARVFNLSINKRVPFQWKKQTPQRYLNTISRNK